MNDFNVSFINLGCVKNLVDTQYLLGLLINKNNGKYKINYYNDPWDKNVKYVILNTCAFLESARNEMINHIMSLCEADKIVYIIGCGARYFNYLDKNNKLINDLNSKYKDKLFYISWQDFKNITIDKLINNYNSTNFDEFKFIEENCQYFTNKIYKYEYLKIAEGCDNKCTYCIIPKIRGKMKSLSISTIIEKIYEMLANDIKEIILISQDSTSYGKDLYCKPSLFNLLNEIDKIKKDFKYRVLYMYPDFLTTKDLYQLSKSKKFIPYFDIPLQHISSNVLKKMGRFYDTNYIYDLLFFIRNNFENSFIRTNFIIGFPGETDEDFLMLKNFIKEFDFDNISLFQYHDEPLSASFKFKSKIDDETINNRFQELLDIINKKLKQKQRQRKGKVFEGWIMGFKNNKDINRVKIIVRPYLSAPDIDKYDEIFFDNILDTDEKVLKISSYIKYKL